MSGLDLGCLLELLGVDEELISSLPRVLGVDWFECEDIIVMGEE
jgi:hypothetical protein